MPYCARCGTALSTHEVAQGYEDVTEPSVYVRFPVVDRDYDLLVWTTTPWTLISNVAVAVGPGVRYVRARTDDATRPVVLAADRVEAVLGPDAEIVGPIDVGELDGPPLPAPVRHPADRRRREPRGGRRLRDGRRRLRHRPPGAGVRRDRPRGRSEPWAPRPQPRRRVGAVRCVRAAYAGQFVKDADAAIIDELGVRGLLVRAVDYTHSYPHCWRCGTPLIYWAKPTWFARTTDHLDALLRENEAIDWHPEHIKHGRFGDWLENNVDWALSRDRFWGTPLPIWRCRAGHDTCVGSISELEARSGRELTALDLHDRMSTTCTSSARSAASGADRVEPVLDAWFDSGSMPVAQFHYPFENAELFERRFPADFICEAIDQTRGWFYSLLAVNTLVFGRSPYRNVVCLALLVDKDGSKMSKSRGNVIDPWTILTTRGADALRWYFFSAGSPWTNRHVDVQMIDESTRRFLVTLWNTYSFFVTYATLDGWSPEASRSAALPRRTCSIVGLAPSPVDRPRRHGCARGVRCARSRTGARVVRRRSLELVRATLTRPVLEGGRPRGARDAPRLPPHGRPAARPSVPVRRRRPVREPRSRRRRRARVRPSRRLARGRRHRRSIRRSSGTSLPRGRSSRSAGPRAPRPGSASVNPCRGRSCCSPVTSGSRPRSSTRSPTS